MNRRASSYIVRIAQNYWKRSSRILASVSIWECLMKLLYGDYALSTHTAFPLDDDSYLARGPFCVCWGRARVIGKSYRETIHKLGPNSISITIIFLLIISYIYFLYILIYFIIIYFFFLDRYRYTTDTLNGYGSNIITSSIITTWILSHINNMGE